MRAGSTHRNEIQPTLCSWSPDRGFLMLLAAASGLSFRTSVVKTQLSVVARSTLHESRLPAPGGMPSGKFRYVHSPRSSLALASQALAASTSSSK